jgi:hypothetical protein
VVFGNAPAMQLTRTTLTAGVTAGGAGTTPARWGGRRVLIALQVAISTALMLIAFASTRAVTIEARHDPGFDLQHLAIGIVNFRPMNWDAARRARAIAALDESARAQPGFQAVAIAAGLPMSTRQFGQVSTADHKPFTVNALPATPGIFRTLGISIVRGRGFDSRDVAESGPVIVLSENVAEGLFGSVDAVGRRVRYQGPSHDDAKDADVIGIARDTDTQVLFNRQIGSVYIPIVQADAQRVFIAGRTVEDPASMIGTFATIVRRADPDLAVEVASTGAMAMTPVSTVLRAAAIASGGLSFLAVLWSMLGLYGVLSHVVARRTREIGLRIALGAEARGMRRMIVGDGLRPVAWGLVAGLVIGIGARVVLRATFEGSRSISAIDPMAFGGAATALLAAGMVACYLPARRASSVDPNVALRDL